MSIRQLLNLPCQHPTFRYSAWSMPPRYLNSIEKASIRSGKIKNTKPHPNMNTFARFCQPPHLGHVNVLVDIISWQWSHVFRPMPYPLLSSAFFAYFSNEKPVSSVASVLVSANRFFTAFLKSFNASLIAAAI